MPTTDRWVTENPEYPFTIGTADWDTYANYRTPLSPSMFATWLQHHKTHGGKLETAHDIGAGSGAGAAMLAPLFDHIHVSDPGEGNIAAAKANLQPAFKFTFATQPAEVAWIPEPASVDFACFCNSLHWTETYQALRNVAASLRLGGTVAACMIAFRLHFRESKELSTLWVAVIWAVFAKLGDQGLLTPPLIAGIRKSINGYDGIAVPDEFYTNIRRININNVKKDPEPYAFADMKRFPPLPFQITENEEVEYMDDANYSRPVDLAWLQGHLRTIPLPMGREIWALPAWKEFEAAMDRHDGPLTAIWPVAVLLATRK